MKDIKAVFDIGNETIKWIVFASDEWKDVVLVKQVEPTKWMRKWKILDSEEFANTIYKITEWFIKKLWWDFIDEVFVSISHPEFSVHRVVEQKRVMKDKIELEDVEHLSKIIADIWVKNNYETIKIVPVHWIIDWQKKEKDPIGLQWKKLELVADLFMIPKNLYNSLIEAFDRVDLNVSDIVPNIISASEVAIDYDHKDLWTILIDIWKNQTSYVVYEDWYPLSYGNLPLWWEDVTKDISIWLQIDIKDAENIKKTKWYAVLNPNEKVEDDWLDLHFLSDIINARYEEIFTKINDHLVRLEKDWRLPWWVLLIWWWSKMANVDILAKDIFKLATFYGKDNQLNLWELSSNIQFVNALWTYVRSNKYTEGRKSNFKLNFNMLGKMGKFFKDLF